MIKTVIVIFLISLLVVSCSKNDETGSDLTSQTGLSIKKLDNHNLDSLILNRNGNILFLNVWATWCVPCVEEFPAIVRLYKNYSAQNVQFIAVSVDDFEDLNSKVIPFIKKNNIAFDIYIQDFNDPQDLINSLHSDWNGAIPATFIYDKNANQQVFLPGKQEYNTFKSELEKVIKVKAD